MLPSNKLRQLALLAGITLIGASAGHAYTTYQAESRTAADGLGTAQKTSGSIVYMDYAGTNGAFLEWNNVNSAAGQFKIVLRYALPNFTTAKLKVVVNGTNSNSPVPEINLPVTGGVTTFVDYTFFVDLNAGTNRIRLEQVGTASINLDYFRVYTLKYKVHTGDITGAQQDINIPETVKADQIESINCSVWSGLTMSDAGLFRDCLASGGNVWYQDDWGNTNWYLYTGDGDWTGSKYKLKVNYWE